MNENNNITEFTLYEELAGYFLLDKNEMLAKLHIHINEINSQYKNLEDYMNYIRRDDLNQYQISVVFLHSVLTNLWNRRN